MALDLTCGPAAVVIGHDTVEQAVQVSFNSAAPDLNAPLGGFKQSGYGR